jgi:hypothetical protein
MQRTRLMLIAAGMALCLLASSCRKSGQGPSLHDRIMAANTSQYCHPEGCFNPHVLVVESGYDVTTFLGSKPQYAQVPANHLAQYLQALPMQAWPRGPSITISPTDDVTDQHAIDQNLLAARRICGSMGLEVQILPGG